MAAPTDISATVTLSVLGGLRWAPTTGASVVQRIAETYSAVLSQGTGAHQIQLAYCETRTGLGGPLTTEQIDLDSGGLTGKDGVALTFSSIRAWGVINHSTTATDIMRITGVFVVTTVTPEVIFGAAGSTWVFVRPGGMVFFAAPQTGYNCSAAAHDKLEIQTVTAHQYTLFVLGLD